MEKSFRTRSEPEANYKSVFFNGKTLRMPIDPNKPVTELRFPEFWDISLGNKCVTGRCNYCYASGNPDGERYSSVVDKVKSFFGEMSMNERPYQIATGGESEPLEHPEFWEYSKVLNELGIVPNFTTNGVLMTERQIENIQKYTGGVAVTYHPHLSKFFFRTLKLLKAHNIKCNVHFIISDTQSINLLKDIYKEWSESVEYFVLLKYINVGFAAKNPKEVDYNSLEEFCDTNWKNGNFAFGARFYEFLLEKRKYDVSLYPPEQMSKYLIMKDMSVYNNSFECKPVPFSKERGCLISNQ